MSEKKKNDGRTEALAGVVAILLIVATFVALIFVASARNAGTISVDGDVRRGTQQTFVYRNAKIKNGQYVQWYVNNEKAATNRYLDGAELEFLPTAEGRTVIRAVAGKYNKSLTVNVMKPLVTISAKNTTITYGETPDFDYEIHGVPEGEENPKCKMSCNRDGCGVFDVVTSCEECTEYDIKCNNATLTVLPKEVRIVTEIFKTYDGKTETECPELQLEGVLDGDDVTVTGEKLYFENKNAGRQKIVTANLCLCGEDCANYVLCDDWEGIIMPKPLLLDGLKICDKPYDGTTKAQIEKLGKLQGVVDGDSVAIGELDVNFENAEVGKQKVSVKKISLVGVDKDNYVVKRAEYGEAEIFSKQK